MTEKNANEYKSAQNILTIIALFITTIALVYNIFKDITSGIDESIKFETAITFQKDTVSHLIDISSETLAMQQARHEEILQFQKEQFRPFQFH